MSATPYRVRRSTDAATKTTDDPDARCLCDLLLALAEAGAYVSSSQLARTLNANRRVTSERLAVLDLTNELAESKIDGRTRSYRLTPAGVAFVVILRKIESSMKLAAREQS